MTISQPGAPSLWCNPNGRARTAVGVGDDGVLSKFFAVLIINNDHLLKKKSDEGARGRRKDCDGGVLTPTIKFSGILSLLDSQ